VGVALSDKGDLLTHATKTMREHGANLAEALYQIWDTNKWFVSSEGHRIDQRIVECGGGISATSIGDHETQRRSYPSARGQYGTRGWELIHELDLLAHAPRVAEESRELLSAPLCPSGETTLILGGEQMCLQIHESVGHAIELDRILGWEAAFAGTSWLDLAQLGSLRYGSELMNITIDPSIPGALGSFGFDDEGTPAAKRYAVRNGTWVGRARRSRLRRDRRPGLRRKRARRRLRAAAHGQDDQCGARTRSAYLGRDHREHRRRRVHGEQPVVVHRRQTAQLPVRLRDRIRGAATAGWGGCCVTRPYTGIGPRFWNSMDMLSNEIVAWGTPNCGKGQPTQVGPHRTPGRAGSFPRRPRGGAVMTTDVAADVAAQALELAARAMPGAQLEARADRSQSALTRFANSFIHQNVDEDTTRVGVRAHRDGRTVSASTTTGDLSALVDRVATMLTAAPLDPGWPGLTQPAGLVDRSTVDEATRDCPPAARADRVRAFVDAAQGHEAAGYCRTSYWSGSYRNSLGQAIDDDSTEAVLDGIARGGGADGTARRTSARLSDVDGAALGTAAAQSVRSQADPVELPPGATR
jgi:TldD protein